MGLAMPGSHSSTARTRVQHRLDLGQCFTGDPGAEEESGAGIPPHTIAGTG